MGGDEGYSASRRSIAAALNQAVRAVAVAGTVEELVELEEVSS